jgi:hypothetical protein
MSNITCQMCGAKLVIRREGGKIIYEVFADEMSANCPEVRNRGEQDGEAEHWRCSKFIQQILHP